MVKMIVAAWAGWASLTAFSAANAAEVINVEFKFTPFVGDPAKEDAVKTVAGTARVYLNGVPYAEQEVSESDVPVLFEEREIAPSVWLPASSCGPALRKGTNTIRIEFEPSDPKGTYRAQLRWASVMNESTKESEGGHMSATNQSGEGVEEKEAKGEVTFEREFQADFATDLPWHHFPAVTALGDADKKALVALLTKRVEAFRPDFAKLYALIEGRQAGVDLAEMKKSKCLAEAYAAGARIAAAAPDAIEFLTTGNPEVVIRAKAGQLFFPADMSVLERMEDEETQMCISVVFALVYPPHLAVVRSPAGAWEIVY
jgi:hypothetical protein